MSVMSTRYLIQLYGENESEIEINLCKKPWVSSFYVPNYDFLNNFPESDRHWNC